MSDRRDLNLNNVVNLKNVVQKNAGLKNVFRKKPVQRKSIQQKNDQQNGRQHPPFYQNHAPKSALHSPLNHQNSAPHHDHPNHHDHPDHRAPASDAPEPRAPKNGAPQNHAAAPPAPPPRRKMSCCKKIALLILILILLCIGAIGWLLGSQSGLNTLGTLASRAVPGLNIGQISGRLSDLTVQNLHYQRPGIQLQASKLQLSLRPSCLWQRRLCVNKLAAEQLSLNIDSQQLPPSPPAPASRTPDLAAPLPISLKQFSLADFTLKFDQQHLHIGQLQSGLHWQGKQLTLTPTRLTQLDYTPAPPRADPAPAPTLSPGEQLQRLFSRPLIPKLEDLSLPVNLTIEQFDAESLQLHPAASSATTSSVTTSSVTTSSVTTSSVTTSSVTTSPATTSIHIAKLHLQLSAIDGEITLAALSIHSDQGQLSAHGTLQSRDNWPLNLTLNGRLPLPLPGSPSATPAPLDLQLHLQGALTGQTRLNAHLQGPINARLQASARLARAGLPFTLNLHSPQLSWPPSAATDPKAPWQLQQLQLNASGKATDYQLSLQSDIRGASLPPAHLDLHASGNERQITLNPLQLALLEGQLHLQGELNWQRDLQANLRLNLEHLNSARQYPDIPATLSGSTRLQARLSASGWQLALTDLHFNGNIKQHPLQLTGTLAGNSQQQWQIDQLHLTLGQNQLTANGQLNRQQLALSALIDAPSLDNLLPALGGQIKGQLTLQGKPQAARLTADLAARRLHFGQLSLAQLTATTRLTLSQPITGQPISGKKIIGQQISGQLQIDARQLHHGEQQLQHLALSASGDELAHQLQLQLQGLTLQTPDPAAPPPSPLSLDLHLRGHYQRAQQRWQGTLTNTQLDTPTGRWTPSHDIALDYRIAQQSLRIGEHCWQNPHGQLCAPRPIELGKQGQLALQLKSWDLASLAPFLPAATRLNGDLTGNLDLHWNAERPGLPQGTLSLQGHNVTLKQTLDAAPLSVAFDRLTLNGQLHNNQAQLDWLWQIAHNGQFSGNIRLQDPASRRALSGNIDLQNFSLDFINALLHSDEQASGTLNAALRLNGDLRQPQLFGELRADNLKLEGNFMPFAMRPSQLALRFNGMTSQLQGELNTSQGQLQLQGDADWHQPENWLARIRARGERLRISVPPVVRLDVTSNVLLQASPRQIQLSGDLYLPWARITVHELPQSAIPVSKDVVMLNDNLQPIEKPAAGIPITSSLKLHIGDDVKLDAFGLKASLTGNLQVTQHQQALGLSGQISIPQGRFRAYGQDLLVRRGELLFSGSPDHVLLNVEAIRNPQSTENGVIAGVRVTGSSDQPKVEVFSDPAMSQQEALSYLLRGQGLDSQQNNSAAMTSALIGLGVAQSGRFIGKIGEAFGISNLTLDTESVGDSSQVVLSGYVLPGLQVKYGVGIFDSLATLTLRYRLFPRLYLEAISGVDQALDLLYQFEF